MKRLDPLPFSISMGVSIRDVLGVIDKNKEGVVLVVDDVGHLKGMITDGDIRRFMLGGNSLDRPCSEAMSRSPTVLPSNARESEIISCFDSTGVRHLPLLSREGLVVDLYVRDTLAIPSGPIIAIIMAGGEGKRLRPITEKIPKPMISVRGRPILEWAVERLVAAGVRELILAVNYKAEMIIDHFGDGTGFGARISYIHEQKKLGTVGALSLLKTVPTIPFLVMNGDILTEVDFGQFFKFHVSHRSLLTIAAMQYNISIPFGVLEHAGPLVLEVKEKPSHSFLCNAGMYVIDPYALSLIPKDEYYDITSLINSLITSGLAVHTFPIHESWIDVGRKGDLLKVDDSYEESFNS